MKISCLHEALSGGDIAFRPAALGERSWGAKKSPRKETPARWYLKYARTSPEALRESEELFGKKGLKKGEPRQPKTNVWQFTSGGKKKKRWWDDYAASNNPDERLLSNFRGKGY